MKFSFMTFSCPELDLESVLELAQRYGYDGIEPRVSAKHQHGIELDATPEQRREIVRKVDASGIQLSCIATSCCFADPANATEHADARQYGVILTQCAMHTCSAGELAQRSRCSTVHGRIVAAIGGVCRQAQCEHLHGDPR